MNLKIKFNEIKDAIEQTSFERHYFIDKNSHKVILISKNEDAPENKLNAFDSNNLIPILPRTSGYDFEMMQSFVYTLNNLNLAQKFEAALSRKNKVKNFKELLDFYPEIKEKWSIHQEKEAMNETMNWLYENDIELKDKSFMPKIMIKELTPGQVKLPEEWETFGPTACLKCNNKMGIKTRYFELKIPTENRFIDKKIKKIMMEKFGIKNYGTIGGGDKEILTSSECSKCKSTDVFWDF